MSPCPQRAVDVDLGAPGAERHRHVRPPPAGDPGLRPQAPRRNLAVEEDVASLLDQEEVLAAPPAV